MMGWRALFYKEVMRFWKVSFQTVAAPVLTAVLYLWGLGSLHWANDFYSAAVQARLDIKGKPLGLSLQADCLTGTWAASMFLEDRGSTQVMLLV